LPVREDKSRKLTHPDVYLRAKRSSRRDFSHLILILGAFATRPFEWRGTIIFIWTGTCPLFQQRRREPPICFYRPNSLCRGEPRVDGELEGCDALPYCQNKKKKKKTNDDQFVTVIKSFTLDNWFKLYRSSRQTLTLQTFATLPRKKM
jgi:hypothetical protein